MNPTKRTPTNLWRAIQDSQLQDDVDEILAMTDAELDAFLTANGGDPAQIRARGDALARDLDARRDRLSWHGAMDEKLASVRAASAALRSAPREPLSRDELLARIARARNDPRLTAPVSALFRGKTPEASTDEELQALFDQIMLLVTLEDE